MLKVAVIVLKLSVVQEVRDLPNEGVLLILKDGRQPVLRATVKDYDYFCTLARRAVERRRPVGLQVENNEVKRVILADQDIAAEILEDGKEAYKIRFLGHDGTYRLDRSHLDSGRMYQELLHSRENRTSVWFIARMAELRLEDVATDRGLGLD